MDDSSPKRYGRGLFLATLFGGLTSIAWGRPVWNRVNGALAGVEALVPLVPHGWRIYSVADHDADVRPRDLAARDRRARAAEARR